MSARASIPESGGTATFACVTAAPKKRLLDRSRASSGLTILALLIALLISTGAASPARAQTPPSSNAAQATKGRVINPDQTPNFGGRASATAPTRAQIPNFIGLTRSDASALAQKYDLEPAFDRPTSNDVHVTDQSPAAGTPISRAAGRVRLQMEAQESPLQRMPNFVRRTRSDASALAQRYGVQPAFEGATSDDARVADQSPGAGTPITRATSRVRLQMEAQAPPVQHGPDIPDIVGNILSRLAQMPDFAGRTRSDASALAQRYRLEPAFEGATSDDARVADQSPAAGTPLLRAAGRVRLQMEAPQSPVQRMPDFVGRTRGDASALAQQYRLEPAFDGPTGDDAHVTGQSPAAGTPIARAGGRVRLQVEAPLQRMPDFVGRTRGDATALAQQYGLQPAFDGPTSDDAHVTGQSPAAGTSIPRAGARVRLQVEAPLQRMPDFVGRTRGDASSLAQQYDLEPAFDGPTSDDAHVTGQSPAAGTPIPRAGGRVRLQVEAPLQRMPDFVGRTRGDASALAQQYGLEPAFGGATGSDAHVGSQIPRSGTLFRAGAPVQLRMEAPPPPPPPAPQVAPPPPAPAPPQTPAPPPPAPVVAPPPPPAPAAPQQTPAQPPPAPVAVPVPPPPPQPACVSRGLISWLTAAPGQAVSPTCPSAETRNWLLLLAIAAGLAGGTWWIFHKPPPPPDHIAPNFNNPQTGNMARLTTQTVSTGLVGTTVSIHAADGPRFEIRYVMECDARPRPDATRIAISNDGDEDDN